MVISRENAANDVDEEVFGNDGAERHEAQEASSGSRAIADADQAGQLGARTLRSPELHTGAARVAHNATHVPFRDRCPFCVASRGRSSPHRRVVVNKTADTLPKFQTDYMFIRTVAERNSTVHSIRGNAQWSSDQLHVFGKEASSGATGR